MLNENSLYELLKVVKDDDILKYLTELKESTQLEHLTEMEKKSITLDENKISRLFKLSFYLDPRYKSSKKKEEFISFLNEVDISMDEVRNIEVRNEIKDFLFKNEHNLDIIKRKLMEDDYDESFNLDEFKKKQVLTTGQYLDMISNISKKDKKNSDEIKIDIIDKKISNYYMSSLNQVKDESNKKEKTHFRVKI